VVVYRQAFWDAALGMIKRSALHSCHFSPWERSPEFCVGVWVDLRRATSFSCWGDRSHAHQPLLGHFTEFFRFFKKPKGYKIIIRCLLRLYINHTSFLMVETVRATAQHLAGKFWDIALVGHELFLSHLLKFVIQKLFYRSRTHKLWSWWTLTKHDTNHSYIYIYILQVFG